MVTIASEPSETVTSSFSFSGQKAADVNLRERSSVEHNMRLFLIGTSYTIKFFFSLIVSRNLAMLYTEQMADLLCSQTARYLREGLSASEVIPSDPSIPGMKRYVFSVIK